MISLNFLANEYHVLKKETHRKMMPGVVVALTIMIGGALAVYLIPVLGGGTTVFYPLFFGLFILITIFHRYYGKAESTFWKLFSEKNHGTYTPKITMEGRPPALFFRKGFKQEIGHHILFSQGTERVELYEYTYFTEHTDSKGNKHVTPHPFTVFDVAYEGKTPHMYLNYRSDFLDIFDGRKVPLPREFEKKFSLYVPEQYEIEALTIFTPEVLEFIINQGIKTDIEFVDGHVLFFTPQKSINFGFAVHLAELEQQYKAMQAVFKKLEPVLDSFKFEKIGSKSPSL